MIFDFAAGVIGFVLGLALGYGFWGASVIFFAAFALDGDIVINELVRIFIKKEKPFGLNNFLDENSYTHKFVFHLPFIIIPIIFLAIMSIVDLPFAILITSMVLFHLIHDTLDANFDGVSWLWPFDSKSYKFRHGQWEIKTREQLKEEAKQLALKPRNTKTIIGDNTLRML